VATRLELAQDGNGESHGRPLSELQAQLVRAARLQAERDASGGEAPVDDPMDEDPEEWALSAAAGVDLSEERAAATRRAVEREQATSATVFACVHAMDIGLRRVEDVPAGVVATHLPPWVEFRRSVACRAPAQGLRALLGLLFSRLELASVRRLNPARDGGSLMRVLAGQDPESDGEVDSVRSLEDEHDD